MVPNVIQFVLGALLFPRKSRTPYFPHVVWPVIGVLHVRVVQLPHPHSQDSDLERSLSPISQNMRWRMEQKEGLGNKQLLNLGRQMITDDHS